jgi:hypothetical protein
MLLQNLNHGYGSDIGHRGQLYPTGETVATENKVFVAIKGLGEMSA